MHRSFFAVALGVACIAMPQVLHAQAVSGELPTRTITTTLKPQKPQREVMFHYFQEAMGICVDTYRLEASRIEIHAGENVVFRMRISRKCNGRASKAPAVRQAAFVVRAIGSKRASSEIRETLSPDSPSFSWMHAFQFPGNYQISVQNRLDDVQVNTVSLSVEVKPSKELPDAV